MPLYLTPAILNTISVLKYLKERKLGISLTISSVLSLLVLNRWIVTPLETASFGRVWQYYVSWFDFGFHRRGLIGTVLSTLRLNRIIHNEYVFSYLLYGCLLAISYILIYKILIRQERLRDSGWVAAGILMSPATFIHFSYSTGNQDIVLFILLLITLFYTHSKYAMSFVLICGVLTHELFIFLLPGIFILKIYDSEGMLSKMKTTLIVPLVASSLSVIGILLFGKLNVSITTYDGLMAQRIPLAAYQHPFWSGYFEVASSVESNATLAGDYTSGFWPNRWSILLPTAYAIFVAWVNMRYLRSTLLVKIALCSALLFPLATTFIATDYYRWVSISACLSLVSLIYLFGRERLMGLPRWILVTLCISGVMAPFGGAGLGRPFPMHSFILENALGRDVETDETPKRPIKSEKK